jgi:Leucine-rich repeat (LRR) protein
MIAVHRFRLFLCLQVTALKRSLPAIEELRLCGNGIEDFGPNAIDDMPTLRLLDLEDNKISQWDDVLKLSSLQRWALLCT